MLVNITKSSFIVQKILILLLIVGLSGCVFFEREQEPLVAGQNVEDMVVTKFDIDYRSYDDLGEVSTVVHKWTIFNDKPSEAEADQELREKAAKLGADAIILVEYQRTGEYFFRYGDLSAKGRAIKFNN